MKSEKKRKKISVDLDSDVEFLLDKKKKDSGMSYTLIINELTRALLGSTPSLRADLNEFCNSAYKKYDVDHYLPGSVAFGEHFENRKQLDRIYKLLNNNQTIDPRPTPEDRKKQQIRILNGSVVVPVEWPQVEWDIPEESQYAGIVEIRDMEDPYDSEPPHFFFTSKREITDLSGDDIIAILRRCYENTDNGGILGAFFHVIDEGACTIDAAITQTACVPELFQIPEAGSRGDDERNYPYGAKVYRD